MDDDLVKELHDEADLCRNETATDIAILLDKAADALERREGWKLVPVEPTEEMLVSVRQPVHHTRPDGWDSEHVRLWKAMLAASPPAKREG